MFGQSSHSERRTEAHEPLLARDDDDRHAIPLDSDDEDDSTALGHADDRRDHAVRFEDHVQVIGPPLRSMLASRETGKYVFIVEMCGLYITLLEFEQDTDEIDESQELEDVRIRVPRGYRDRTMPLLVGLFDSSTSRGRLEVSVPLLRSDGTEVSQPTADSISKHSLQNV
ncbi:hypothetical protein B0H17DRAFT_92903 [Mycena rosella]|uniref:Uncharacterized protein n=1 Tax=Mycena rosella TaxID=1033263 RepID=A0AAD7E0M7_MYCRO|nr:hypothetical protein B0H17DRAFT_92903 [Mycena rosella]